MLLYALYFGFGVGTLFFVPFFCAWSHFPKNIGISNSVVLCGFACGIFILGIIPHVIMNPKGLKPNDGIFPSGVAIRLPKMLRIMAMIMAGLTILTIILINMKRKTQRMFIRNRRRRRGRGGNYMSLGEIETNRTSNPNITRSDQQEENKEGNQEQNIQQNLNNENEILPIANNPGDENEINFSDAIKDYKTHILIILMILSLVQPSLAIFSLREIDDGDYFTVLSIISCLIFCIACTVVGLIVDKTKCRYLFIVTLAIQIILGFSMNSAAKNRSGYFVWFTVSSFFFGTILSMIPCLLIKVYGQKTASWLSAGVFSPMFLLTYAFLKIQEPNSP